MPRPPARTGVDDRRAVPDAFLRAPLYLTDYARGMGTLYTAAYDVGARSVEYRWPGVSWPQSLADFTEGTRLVGLAEEPAA